MEFRTLEPDDIELRVGMANNKGFSLLLYKNARVDMQLLDETVGSMNWKREHTRDNANCIVSVWDAEKNEWVSKEDTGTESQTEREKGLASDSFKRACVNWGIGRELYTAPFVWISGHVENDSRARSGYKADQRYVSGLKITNISYTEKRTVAKLVIEDASGEIAYSYGVKRGNTAKQTKTKAERPTSKTISEEHSAEIKALLEETNANVTAFLKTYGAKSVDEMTEEAYLDAVKRLHKKQEQMKGDKDE